MLPPSACPAETQSPSLRQGEIPEGWRRTCPGSLRTPRCRGGCRWRSGAGAEDAPRLYDTRTEGPRLQKLDADVHNPPRAPANRSLVGGGGGGGRLRGSVAARRADGADGGGVRWEPGTCLGKRVLTFPQVLLVFHRRLGETMIDMNFAYD